MQIQQFSYRFFMSLALVSMTVALSAQAQPVKLSRIANVMHKGFGGIQDVSRRIKFADTKNLSKDLNISEISARFDCKTKLGKNFISFYLDKVISSKDTTHTIEHRLQMIKAFADYPEILVQFEQIIEKVQRFELAVDRFMAKRVVVDELYFSEDPIKFTMTWMNQSFLWQTYSTWLSLTTVATPLVSKVHDGCQATYNYAAPFVQGTKDFNILGELRSVYNAQTDYSQSKPQEFIVNSTLAALNLGKAGYDATTNTRALWGFLLAGYSLYTHYYDACEKREALYALNQLIYAAQQIEKLCAQYEIAHQFKISSISSSIGLELLQELAHERYQEKDSSFFFTPAVTTFIYKVYQHDSLLAPMYASIAEIDAYVAIAKKNNK